MSKKSHTRLKNIRVHGFLKKQNSFLLLILIGSHEAISKEKLISPISLIDFLNSTKPFVLEKEKHFKGKKIYKQKQNTKYLAQYFIYCFK